MSFGFSVGDFIAVIQLAIKIQKEFVDAPSQFKPISDEVRTLSIVLQDAAVAFPNRELDNEQKRGLEIIDKGCRNILDELQQILENNTELIPESGGVGKRNKRVWKRLNWKPEDIDQLQNRINTNINLLNTFNGRPTRDNVAKLVRHQEDQGRQTVLNWLTPVDYASQQSDFISRREPGTGQWLLESAEFQAWVKTDQQVLICPGIPGAGKTILTSIVVDYLYANFQKDTNIGIAYIYCNFRRQDEQKADGLLASLLKQLAQGLYPLPESVKSLYDSHKKKRTRPTFNEISSTLQSVAALYSRSYIVVDALDECLASDGCRTEFLTEIFALQAKSRANIFSTSRFIPEIDVHFKTSMRLEIRATDHDVQRYIDGHMSELPTCVLRNSELQGEIKASIVKAVNGMFLLAKLHLDSLKGKRSPKAIRTALKELSIRDDAYDDAYNYAMARIEGQLAGEKELSKQVLSWITCARRPLTTSELEHALAVELGELQFDKDNLYPVENMVSVCAGLVTVDEESAVIRFAHYTILEYFQRTQKKWFPNAEMDITAICVTYLSFRTFDSGFCPTDEEFETRLRSHPFYSYAARHWADHALAVSGNNEQITLDFLKNESQVSSSYQALMASSQYPGHRGYSQKMARQVTGLHLAAYFGLEHAMTTLLSSGLNPICKDSEGQTPLWWAAERGFEPVMILLSQRDRATLPTLVRQEKMGLIRSVIHAGYNVNAKGFWNRTLLHEAILSRNLELTEEIISCGADVNSEDSDGMIPLQVAVRLKQLKLVELLLKSSASTKDIMVDEWRCVYGEPASVTVKLLEGPGQEKYLEFIQEAKLQGELTKTPNGHETQKRLFLFKDDSPWEKGWIVDTEANLERNKLDIQHRANERGYIYSVTVWFSMAQGQESKEIFGIPIDEKIRIAWTMICLQNSNGESRWRPMDHFSTLKYAWIPEYSLQFFICLIRHLKEKWLKLCYLGQKHITQCRRDVYDGKGEKPGLIGHLLEDAQQWTDFRSYVRDQVDTARKFSVGYSHRFLEEIALRELQTTVDDFERQINDEIDLLDKSSQSLIEIEFNLVSINEARRSITMSASMKRLSWITFIFLPAMFTSSLFGMNVSILKDNPDWRWYLLFGGASQVLTITAWLSFKYIPIETWIESKAHYVQQKLAGMIPRTDVENAIGSKKDAAAQVAPYCWSRAWRITQMVRATMRGLTTKWKLTALLKSSDGIMVQRWEE
ncbi:hypothetical protein V501_03493 [Pseudogymnoascus sp. VKM F-4519 (FW-2642)]|nr:hypothetical protein V501_03493 [Pseudogymnoascus sp. VKM F-4519 (FW-2642)]